MSDVYHKRLLKQKAVYWPLGSEESGGVDTDAYGRPNYGTAYEVWCRWETKNIEFIDANMTRRLSKSIVYLRSDVRVGGVLMLGTLSDVTNLTIPKKNDYAFEVFRFDKSPTLNTKQYIRKAYL